MKFPPHHVRHRLWHAIFLVLLAGPLRAGDYSVTTWGVDEGLAQSSVTSIAQTPDGFLWIGTRLSGVSRFDGVKFVNYDSANTPSLTSPGVRRLLVDSTGSLWLNDTANDLLLRKGNAFVKVGEDLRLHSLVSGKPGHVAFATEAGELIIGQCDAGGQWTWQRHKPPGIINYVISYYEDREGVFWFQLEGKIGRFANGRFEILDSLPGLASGKIRTVTCDTTGQVWAGTATELARWQHGVFTNLNPGGPASSFLTQNPVPTPDGGMWVEADGKLLLYEHEHWSEPVPDWNREMEPWSRARSFRSDNVGGLWISLDEAGLVHASPDGRLVRVTSADGLPGQLVQVFFTDSEGNFWAGYHRGGLVLLRKETFHTIKPSEGLQDRIVTSVTEDQANAIWLGMSSGSVSRWADGVLTNFSLPLRGGNCQDVVAAAGPAGRVWLGTSGNGLVVWEQNEFRHALLPAQMPQGPQGVVQLLVAMNGEVWFANPFGLYRFDGQKNIRMLATKTSEQVASLTQAADGTIWFGTFSGVLRSWQDGKLTSYRPLDDLPSTRFWALYPEADGTLWIGTMGRGLLRFKSGVFQRFTTADGLADDYISHILMDDDGHLWLGSHAGVMCISKKAVASAVQRKLSIPCRLFGRSDGLPTVAMTWEFQPSCVKAHDGALWFASPKGATWVNPDDVRSTAPAPPVLLEAVLVDNSVREFSAAAASSKWPEIILEPGAKNLEVRFTSPTFTAPELTRFKYRLNQRDADWINLGGQRNVTFNNLAVGEYVFQVMAENSDGLWSLNPAEFRILVQPHFWQRTSFQAATLLGLLGCAAFTARRITQIRFRRKLEALRQQQQIEQERARIAQDLHDELGAGLTEISMASDLAEKPDISEHETRQYTHEIGTRARELVQRMDEIVWAVNPRNDSVASLSSYACEYAQLFLHPLNIECVLEVQSGLPEISLNAEQRYNFFLAFKEAINNIARHSGATKLRLAIHAENGRLVFLIDDNGRGFVPDAGRTGADGLRNIRERITRLKGECEISSQPGQGTRVMLRVPLTVNAAKS